MSPLKQAQGSSSATLRLVPLIVSVGGAKNKVAVTGDFTGWSPDGLPMKSVGQGKYRVNLQLPPGRHQYRLIVDGAWQDDPDAGCRVANPFGGENCILDVS